MVPEEPHIPLAADNDAVIEGIERPSDETLLAAFSRTEEETREYIRQHLQEVRRAES